MAKEFCSVAEAAAEAGISPRKARGLVLAGRVERLRIGKRTWAVRPGCFVPFRDRKKAAKASA